MTAARRQLKSRRQLIYFLALAGAGFTVPLSRPIFAATTERIVSDPGSGLAIGGFDPVAYFTDAAPRLGSSDLERSFAGVVWRFRNEGNRAAFISNPEVYMPRFGGYDPVAARDMFAGAPGPAIGAAERGWPALLRTPSP